jgi:hypothetical protein
VLDVQNGGPAKLLAGSTVADARAAAGDWLEFMERPPPVARVDNTFVLTNVLRAPFRRMALAVIHSEAARRRVWPKLR